MKYTLLEIVQRTLSSIKGEQVNDIADTDESLAVVDIVKECFYTLVASQDYPEQKTLFELTASGDSAKPVLMTLPDDVYSLEWLKYDNIADDETDPNWQPVKYLSLQSFVEMVNAQNLDETNVLEMTVTTAFGDTVQFKYRNDRAPTWYTSIDDTTLIFDSFDAEIENTLQKNKTQAYGIRLPEWQNDNAFVPNLDAHQFAILIKEAKVMAWQELKSIDNAKAAREARDLRISAEQRKSRANQKGIGYYYTQYPNYGRK